MASVELRVKSGLESLISDLDELKKKATEVNTEFGNLGKQTTSNLKKNTKEAETFLGNLGGYAGRVANQIKKDFKALMSVQSLAAGLSLSDQFKNSISETIELGNMIRKLGATFGIAGKDFATFQKNMTTGLGDIGLSSESAARALEGLSQTPVRGQENLIEYSKTAGQLSSLGREPGREGDIARSLARVIQARGLNPNNRGEMNALAESVRRVTIQTGQQPSQVLSNMEALFARMPEDLRKSISSTGLANLAAAQAVGGPNATKFLEEILGKSPIARMAFEAQGGRGIFGDDGIDIEKFKAFAASITGRVGGDPRLAAQTLGLSEEAAEGFVRLASSLDLVADAQDRIKKSTGSLAESYREAMGFGESFRANINRVKGNMSGLMETLLHGGAEGLSKASQSDIGSAAVVGGTGLLAALLTGGGIRGILGTVAKGAAAESITGEKVIPVYVTNAAEIAAGSALGGGGSGALGTAGKVLGGTALAVGGAVAAREAFSYVQEKTGPIGPSAQDTVDFAQSVGGDTGGAVMEKLVNAIIGLNNLLGANFDQVKRPQKVQVEMKSPMLKETPSPSRGSSVGPR